MITSFWVHQRLFSYTILKLDYLYENKCQKPSKKVAWLGGSGRTSPPQLNHHRPDPPRRPIIAIDNMHISMTSNFLSGARGAYAAPKSRANLTRRATLATRRPCCGSVTTRAAKTPDGPRVAIAGISGAVGTEFMRVGILALILSTSCAL